MSRSGFRSTLLWALAASLAIHLAFLAYTLMTRRSQPQRPASHTASELPAAGPINSGTDEVAAYLDAEGRYVARRPARARLPELRLRVDELAKIDAAEVSRMTALVESALGVPPAQRAFEPRPDAAGEFDPNTASLYDITKTTGPDGRTFYERIYVDAAGRTLHDRVPDDEMPSEDLTAFGVFEMARQAPSLRPLIDLVRRYAEQPEPGSKSSE